MPRSGKVRKRKTRKDPVYDSSLVEQIVNNVMSQGKKNIARKHVYGALEKLEKKGKEPLKILREAISRIGPSREVRPRRVGGASYLVPVNVSSRRSTALAVKWLVDAANKRSNQEYKTFANKLFVEIEAALNNEGAAIERKETSHRVAKANKAFSHFRW